MIMIMLMLIILFSLSKTQNYMFNLSARDNQKLSTLLSKGFERSVCWSEYKTKSENKITTNKYRYILKSNFVGVNILFALVYTNQDDDVKRFKVPKVIINNYYVIINGKSVYDQPINSDIKRFEEIRKITTEQGKDYNTWCLLGNDYIKNHYRLIAVDLIRQK